MKVRVPSSDDVARVMLNNAAPAYYSSHNQTGYGYGGMLAKAGGNLKSIATAFAKYYGKKMIKEVAKDVALRFKNPTHALKKHLREQGREFLGATLIQSGRDIINGSAFGMKRQVPREGYQFTSIFK